MSPPRQPSPAQPSRQPPRAWQRMLSGRRLDLLDPSPADIEIVDIAHGLARVARWNGQTTGPHAFSVAQHSLLVETILQGGRPETEPRWLLAALLHDAPEYVVGDLISPFKAALGLDYKAFENRLLSAIHVRFGLPETLPPAITAAIKAADRIAAYWEATELAGFTIAEALLYFGEPDFAPRSGAAGTPRRAAVMPEACLRHDALEPCTTAVAQARFLDRFAALNSQS